MGNLCSIKGSKNEPTKKRNLRQKCTSAVETIRKSLKIKSKKASIEDLSAIIEKNETANETAAAEIDNKVEKSTEEIQQLSVTNEESPVQTEDCVNDDEQINSQMSRDSSIITAVYVEDKLIEFGEENQETELIKEYLDNYRENESNLEELKTENNSDSFDKEVMNVKLEVDIQESNKLEVIVDNEDIKEQIPEISNEESKEETTESSENIEEAPVKENNLNLIDLEPIEIAVKAE